MDYSTATPTGTYAPGWLDRGLAEGWLEREGLARGLWEAVDGSPCAAMKDKSGDAATVELTIRAPTLAQTLRHEVKVIIVLIFSVLH